MERNKITLEIIHSQLENDELCHMTPEEKKAYNAEYYKRNKEKFWGVTGDRPVGRQKYVTEGGSGVQRRGSGLGTGPVGKKRNGKNRTTLTENVLTENILTENILTEQTPEQWSQQHSNQHKPSKWDSYKENISNNLNAIENATKKAAKQAASDWKSGAKAVSQLASESVAKGKKIASAILSKFMR